MVEEQKVQQSKTGRFFKYIARKMGCARNNPPPARDDMKQRENDEEGNRRAISAPRRSTYLKQQALAEEE